MGIVLPDRPTACFHLRLKHSRMALVEITHGCREHYHVARGQLVGQTQSFHKASKWMANSAANSAREFVKMLQPDVRFCQFLCI